MKTRKDYTNCPKCNHPIILLGFQENIYFTCSAFQSGACDYREDIPWMDIETYEKTRKQQRFTYPDHWPLEQTRHKP